jgi:hypothetical protein
MVMSDGQRFSEYYRTLADDQLARIALEDELIPDAKEALGKELRRRGISDLSEYKEVLDESKASTMAMLEQPVQSSGLLQFRLWGLVFVAWLFAASGPFIFAANTHDLGLSKVYFVGLAIVAFSCYLGIKAKREGSRAGYFLKLILPLMLLGISSVIALAMHL